MNYEHLRPSSLEEALSLLLEENLNRKPIAGGTSISPQHAGKFGIVDLKNIGLDYIQIQTGGVRMGSTVRLNELMSKAEVSDEIKRAIRIDVGENPQNMATMGGWMISSDGSSALATVLLALDSTLLWEPGEKAIQLGDWLPLRKKNQSGVLLKELSWRTRNKFAFEYVAPSSEGCSTLVVAVARWGSGRTRIALGGFGESPIIAMDGPDDSGVEIACRDAYHDADDQRASAKYRREEAPKLALRCLERIERMQAI